MDKTMLLMDFSLVRQVGGPKVLVLRIGMRLSFAKATQSEPLG